MHGAAAVAGLLAAWFLIALVLPPMFLRALGLYYAMTNAYSFFLKRKLVIDVVRSRKFTPHGC